MYAPRWLALSLTLVGCGPTLVGTDPKLSPTERSAALSRAPRPELARGVHYESTTVERDVAIPIDVFRHWFERTGSPRLGTYLQPTASFPGVTQTEAVRGAWHHEGARRRVVFSDGSSALEEVVAQRGPALYQYQTWNVTYPLGRYISYAVGEFALSPTSAGTRIRWTYFVRPKAWPDGWFIRSSVEEDLRELMGNGLKAMTQQALADVASPRSPE